jgi:hypothetical protein
MATIVNLPGASTVAISTLTVGQWCVHASYPGSVLCLLEKRATDSLFAQFSETANCAPLVRANSQLVTPVSNPESIELTFPI